MTSQLVLKPGRNAAIIGSQTCQLCKVQPASVDAPIVGGPWGYLCLDCLHHHGTSNPGLINNITSEELPIPWLTEKER